MTDHDTSFQVCQWWGLCDLLFSLLTDRKDYHCLLVWQWLLWHFTEMDLKCTSTMKSYVTLEVKKCESSVFRRNRWQWGCWRLHLSRFCIQGLQVQARTWWRWIYQHKWGTFIFWWKMKMSQRNCRRQKPSHWRNCSERDSDDIGSTKDKSWSKLRKGSWPRRGNMLVPCCVLYDRVKSNSIQTTLAKSLQRNKKFSVCVLCQS